MYAGDGSTRADKKAGKKYFGGSEGAGEKKKIFLGGSEKKFWRQREHNPQKKLRTVESQSNKKDSGGSGGIPTGLEFLSLLTLRPDYRDVST